MQPFRHFAIGLATALFCLIIIGLDHNQFVASTGGGGSEIQGPTVVCSQGVFF
jgi:membrane protein involved in colicin uptake